MFVTGIHITTTHNILLHIDKVKFYDTSNIAIDLLGLSAMLCGHLQEYT